MPLKNILGKKDRSIWNVSDIALLKNKKSIEELLEFGIIVIDKPSGPTSFQVSAYIREKLGLTRTGHLGTLDPAVSGVLPVTLDRACRLSEYLLGAKKRYIGIMRLHENVDNGPLAKAMAEFVGKIKQMPPVKSSVKRAIREREVYSWTLLERNQKDVLFDTEVQAGTYIRTLVHDLGKKIGGAHMLELRRIQAGIFEEHAANTLYDFDNAIEKFNQGDSTLLKEMIIPGEIIGKILPKLIVKAEHVSKYLRGAPIHRSELSSKSLPLKGKIAVFSDDKMIGCYTVINKGDLYAKPELVLN